MPILALRSFVGFLKSYYYFKIFYLFIFGSAGASLLLRLLSSCRAGAAL